MPKFVLIIGPQAVGKMTVGQELEKITDLKFMHNHDTIDLVTKFFDFGTKEMKKLNNLFRFSIFEEVAKSDLDGMIFTMVFAFELQSEWEWLEKVKEIYDKENGEVYIVELEADLEERLKRNKTENRLKHKPSKRNLEWSERELLESMNEQRLNSYPGEVKEKKYLRINNTNLSAEEVARMIKEKFDL